MSFDPVMLPALAVAAGGAAIDVRERRLPNRLCALLAVIALATAIILSGWGIVWSSAAHGAIALGLGAGLFAMGLIGAGDAKFYAAAALGVPLSGGITMLAGVALSGLILLLGMMILRIARRLPLNRGGGWTLPFGVPIFFGFAAALVT